MQLTVELLWLAEAPPLPPELPHAASAPESTTATDAATMKRRINPTPHLSPNGLTSGISYHWSRYSSRTRSPGLLALARRASAAQSWCPGVSHLTFDAPYPVGEDTG